MRNDLKRLRAHQIKGMPVRGTTFFFSKFYQKKNKFFVEFFTGDGEKWSREAAIYFLFFSLWMNGGTAPISHRHQQQQQQQQKLVKN